MRILFYMPFSISPLFPHTQKHTLTSLKNVKTLIYLLPAVLLFILLLLQPAFAGAPPIQWQKTFGGSNRDEGYYVQQTSDGGYKITGFYGTYYSPMEGGYVCLIKTEPNGNSDWQQTFGGGTGDCGCSVQQTSDGGYIITGWTSSFGSGEYDVYLIKTEPNGNSQWQKTFGGSQEDRGYSVQQTTDGGYIIVGRTESYGAGLLDVYLIKTDPNGDSQWQKTFGGSSWDDGSSVQQTADGGYIIAGLTMSFGAGNVDFYLIKTDPNGDKKWQKTFGGNNRDWGYSVQQTTDGGYIIAGRTYSYGAGNYDVYLIKLSCESIWLGDLNCNGKIYFDDLAILTDQWLQPPVMLSADIFPELGDGIVNGFDFAALANNWLQTTIP